MNQPASQTTIKSLHERWMEASSEKALEAVAGELLDSPASRVAQFMLAVFDSNPEEALAVANILKRLEATRESRPLL